jgi:hypothetical protein
MSKRMPKGRNPVAFALALRGTGKAMKDRRAPRGPERSAKREVERQLRDEGIIDSLDSPFDEWDD